MPRHWSETVDWIWAQNWDESREVARIVQFRRRFKLEQIPSECPVHISADTRYRLYVNGHSVCFGPAKSHLGEWNYETVDIASFCRVGHNAIAVRVLRYSAQFPGNMSLARANQPGLIVHSAVLPELGTNNNWRWKTDDAVRIHSPDSLDPSLGPSFLSINEQVDGSKQGWYWLDADFDDVAWDTAVKVSMRAPMLPIMEPRRLTERIIPLLPEIPTRFSSVVKSDSLISLESWNKLIQQDQALEIPAGHRMSVVLESSTLTTGFLRLQIRGGAGVKIRIRCAECFEHARDTTSSDPFVRHKGDRTDTSGILIGYDDYYTCGPHTYLDKDIIYEPFWFRTFRYVELDVENGCAPLQFLEITYRETHYPLKQTTQLATFPTDEEFQMWKISINTLRNCMHETYEDCPFYEQNQFPMDSRLQILFTYQLSHDDRLARKCMQEFYASRRADGLLESHFPAPLPVVNIPYFPLYWILIVHDHMMYFGNNTLVRRYLGTIDGILDHFHDRIDGRGLVGRLAWDVWPFVDWTQQWSNAGDDYDFRNLGVPPAYGRTGVITYSSLLYSLTLQRAADLCEFVGRCDTAAEYRHRASKLNEAIMKYCFRGEFLVDGPDSPPEERSQHSYVFAVLCGVLQGETAHTALRSALTDPTFVRCSYAMSFYVFEVLRVTGLYDELRDSIIEPWRNMINQNLTTWAESAVMGRSDCHAWSAVPIHDFVANIAGLTPAAPGFKQIRLEPRRKFWSEMSGSFAVGKESVSLSWAPGTAVYLVSTFDTEVQVCDRRGRTTTHKVEKDKSLTLQIYE